MKRILPSYPLWIIDPLFSVWSNCDELNGSDTVFWNGLEHRAYGFVRYNGKTYRFMGISPDVEPIPQTDVNVSAFETACRFENDLFELTVTFVSPRLLTDLQLMSCPVCYTDYKVTAKNGRIPSDLSVAIVLDEDFCYNEIRSRIVGGVLPRDGYEAAFFTKRRNLVMSDTSDVSAPEWGTTYIAGDEAFFVTDAALNGYLDGGKLEYRRIENERSYIIAISRKSAGSFITAFDDLASVFYFGQWLKGYFFKDGKTVTDALDYAYANHGNIVQECREFDRRLLLDCKQIGKDYYLLACASLRQSVGAQKLVENGENELLFLSKECNSGGFIGTVDVSYPSIPLFLLYNPKLVEGLLNGVFRFARMPVWTYGFAPHDIGMYPWCVGQLYGVNKRDDKYGCGLNGIDGKYGQTAPLLYLRNAKSSVYDYSEQMPVEECGNMLIMTAAAIFAGGGLDLAKRNFDLLKKWVTYLEKFGLQPESQLCTDDFAGHLANNVNLSIKALVGIESFSLICEYIGERALAQQYKATAVKFASDLKALTGKGVMPLAYGKNDSYSLKYNILFDKLFGFNLIGQDVCERETDFYVTKNNRYGVPLDSRKDYTKSDWILWTAALTDSKEKCYALYEPVVRFLAESPAREPFIDWYHTADGGYISFRNRSVQGGIFAPLLKYKLTSKTEDKK